MISTPLISQQYQSAAVLPSVSLCQMGLLLDLSPDGGMGDVGNDEELEAELLNLVGGGGGRSQGRKDEGRGEKDFLNVNSYSLSASFSSQGSKVYTLCKFYYCL